jgi:mono/diheme cytochrome c family protein
MSTRARRGLILIGLLLSPFIVGLLFTFEIIKINFPTDMADQPALGYQEGPRLLPPENSVPIQAEPIVLDALPTNPIPADSVSLQRGEILYSIHCSLCHGTSGRGDGPVAEYYDRQPPSDLSATHIAFMFDGTLYRTISQGFGQMPGLSENLTPRERWDVINYLRTLEEK